MLGNIVLDELIGALNEVERLENESTQAKQS